MSDSAPILPDAAAEKTPLVSDGGSMSDTKHRTIIEDTKSRSGGQPESKEVATQTKPDFVAVGTKLGPYELVRKLGQGGMGAVYEARHTKLNKTFALKVLPAGFALNEGAVTRFEREMQAIGKLDHPHIIKATDAGEFQGTHYLVMEYIEGTDLSVLVKTRGPLSVRDACKAIRQAALGLQHAHEHGLVHRDIKPSNLFVTKSGQIKLLDLGLARLGDDGEQQRGLTSVGQILGTPDYMAPEQWDDTHSVDARADLYSLGCTLCFVLTGRAPYADVTKSSLLQLMKAHVEGAIPNLTDTRLDVPPELNAIFVRLLAKQAEARYPNAAEVIAALEPFTRKAADDSALTSKPVFAPGKEPPTAHTVPSTSAGKAGRDGERSGQRSIKSLSASSTDDAFASDRPMIHGDSSTSLAETIIQPRAASGSRRRWPLIIGLSGLGLALLIGIVIQFTLNAPSNSASREASAPGRSADDETVRGLTPSGSKNLQGWHGWPVDAPKPAIAPFSAELAKHHQEEWAAYLKVPVEYSNSIGMKFRLVPPGEFMMGGNAADIAETLEFHGSTGPWAERVKSEVPQHHVVLTQPVFVGVHEVTQKDYFTVTGEKPSFLAAKAATTKDATQKLLSFENHPVEDVSWTDAAHFASKICGLDKFDTFYIVETDSVRVTDGKGYRLLTEAEWEFSCRAGTTTRFWTGEADESVAEAGWFGSNSDGRTHPVGLKNCNPFGLLDTHGNVFEWCHDSWEATYYGELSDKITVNPFGPSQSGPERVIRGGGFGHPERNSRSSMRLSNAIKLVTAPDVGFRIALPIEAVRKSLAEVGENANKSVANIWPVDSPTPATAPFDSKRAALHQKEWAVYLGVPIEYTNSIGMKFCLIPPGEFTMGMTRESAAKVAGTNSNDTLLDMHCRGSAPSHRIRLTQTYYLGAHEVTQGQYMKISGRNPAFFSTTGGGAKQIANYDTMQHPVEMVSHMDAVAFTIALSEAEKCKPAYSIENQVVTLLPEGSYRLPTEAEWEGACRAGTESSWFSGAQELELENVAWFGPKANGMTHPTGQLQSNPYGLFDIHGNVWEWCEYWHHILTYAGRRSVTTIDPRDLDANLKGERGRVFRGGGWNGPGLLCYSGLRRSDLPNSHGQHLGFRVLLSTDVVRQALASTSDQ